MRTAPRMSLRSLDALEGTTSKAANKTPTTDAPKAGGARKARKPRKRENKHTYRCHSLSHPNVEHCKVRVMRIPRKKQTSRNRRDEDNEIVKMEVLD